MGDEEIDFSDKDLFSNSSMDLPCSCFMDNFLDDILNTQACTHTHTCNPPGPDSSHTHTCLHIHTKFVPGTSEEKLSADDIAESGEQKSKKRNMGGNREAVRKYRQKKKSMAASLEDEVARLKAENQELMRRLQSRASLEAEIVRLKCLLVDIRGRIDREIGNFPYQKGVGNGGDIFSNINNQNLSSTYVLSPCNFQSDDQDYCLYPGLQQRNNKENATVVNGNGFDGCDFENFQWFGNQNNGCGKNGVHRTNPPTANMRRGKSCNDDFLNPLTGEISH